MLTLKTPAALAALLMAGAAGAATTPGFANGGFETVGADGFAQGWRVAPTGNPALLSSDAHTGSHSILLTVPNGFGASTLFQDSFGHGGLPLLGAANVGDTPVLSFWAKGDVSTTGNVLFSLAYMSETGQRLFESGNRFFQSDITPGGWTQISFQGAAIPAGTASLFLEINTAVGPLLDGRVNAVYIDDVQFALTTAPVPEPESYALLAAGLAVVGMAARRRRA
ncbi:MAG TPA: PEP-CTERM sorting domain-containing protein [Roseateles sp.]